ncbi:hypothetical protein [Streptomyces sp. HPF1205]|uniref:hypothetical protein n=1 Tax=Streptomyces sp. HPF1205 TaxID=2873262 RepID=UPI001CED69D4|nr:hypothetical protein [Streptomyces sp. HPF1205]
MGKGLTAAQRRAVAESDPATGRLSARPEVCVRLVAAGLAAPHGRGGHHAYYLTSEGLRLRSSLSAPPREDVPSPAPGSGARENARAGVGFTADDGTGEAPPAPGRAAEVATAWEGLLRIREVLLDGRTDRPAPWELERQVHAVALALEAAGCPPARPDTPGYTVTPSPHPGAVRLAWKDPHRPGAGPEPDPGPSRPGPLDRVAALLPGRGWQPTLHRTREGSAYLLVSPRR